MNSSFRKSRAPTKLARKAIADFVESNIPRFNGWLEQVAGGIPQYDQHGVVQLDPRGCPIWLVKPDPAQALKLVTDIAEYHLPKLSRTEATVVAQVESAEFDPSKLSTLELQKRLLVALGMGDDVIEVVPVEAPQTRSEAQTPIGVTTDMPEG